MSCDANKQHKGPYIRSGDCVSLEYEKKEEEKGQWMRPVETPKILRHMYVHMREQLTWS